MIQQHMLFFDTSSRPSELCLDSEPKRSQRQERDEQLLLEALERQLLTSTARDEASSSQAEEASILIGVERKMANSITDVIWPYAKRYLHLLEALPEGHTEQPDFLNPLFNGELELPESPAEQMEQCLLGLCEWLLISRQAQCFNDPNARLLLYVGPEKKMSQLKQRHLRDPETDSVFTYFVEHRKEPSIIGMLPMPTAHAELPGSSKMSSAETETKSDALEDSVVEALETILDSLKEGTAPDKQEEEADLPSLENKAQAVDAEVLPPDNSSARAKNKTAHTTEASAKESTWLPAAAARAISGHLEEEAPDKDSESELPGSDDILVMRFTPQTWRLLRSVALTYGFSFNQMEAWMSELFRLLQGLSLVVDSWQGPILKIGLASQGQLRNVTPWFYRPYCSQFQKDEDG